MHTVPLWTSWLIFLPLSLKLGQELEAHTDKCLKTPTPTLSQPRVYRNREQGLRGAETALVT